MAFLRHQDYSGGAGGARVGEVGDGFADSHPAAGADGAAECSDEFALPVAFDAGEAEDFPAS
ncbi:hypothetical protein IU448_02155 [Nocardia flavorosea]|uniref:hypothetical protein n=1 Tax=Nocardia flavorosea TaxID=53429 RepID=UPI0018963B68|nr:hypothetical protein [Nocardia flavorosea]MBF6347816.1 hypothetical protein [Nocardia flavorosea]